MEIWQLTDNGAEECYRLAYPNNQQKISIDRSSNRVRMFTLDSNGLEQDDITLHEGGVISGAPLADKEKNKVFEFLKKLKVKGF